MASDRRTPRDIGTQGITRSGYRYTMGRPPNSLRLDGDVVHDNFTRCRSDLEVFRENVKFVIYMRGYSTTQVFKELARHGISGCRQSFYSDNLKKSFPSVLYISTFARVLGVPTWMLLHPDIEQVFQP